MSRNSDVKSEIDLNNIGPETTVKSLARVYGVSVPEMLAALRNYALMQIIEGENIGGGGVFSRSPATMALTSSGRLMSPEWWPPLLWNLHFGYPPRVGGHGINDPKYTNHIMAGLHMHTMTYMLDDKKSAQTIRTVIEKMLAFSVQNLHKRHEEAARKEKSGRK